MPSPVGHSLLGLALGAQAALHPDSIRGLLNQTWRKRWPLALAVLLANAPDVDYLPGLVTGDFNAYHHLYTHTLGWCVLLSLGCCLLVRALIPGARSLALLGWCLALTGSHLLADWLTADSRPPIGIMALWPFDSRSFIAPATLFPSVHKRDYSEILQWHNVKVLAIEAAWCLPLVLGVVALKCRGQKSNAAR